MTQRNLGAAVCKNSNEVSETGVGSNKTKQKKTLSVSSLIDKFMWGDL